MSLEGIKRGFEDLWKDIQAFPKRVENTRKVMPEKERTKIGLIAGAVAIVAAVIFAVALSPVGLAPLGAALGLGLGIGVGLHLVKKWEPSNLNDAFSAGRNFLKDKLS